MSGSHQFYTITGRALPLPPKRTPSRHSNVLRLPTRRADQERSTTVPPDSPGRIEVPHGGEFHNVSVSQRKASQLVVYEGTTRRPTGIKTAAAASSKASSVARSSRHASSFAATTTTTAAGGAAVRVSTSRRESTASSQDVCAHRTRRYVQRWTVESTVESGRSTPRRRSGQVAADSDASSDSDSPSLNPLKFVDDGAAPEVQSIPMSSAHHSRVREEREQSHKRESYSMSSSSDPLHKKSSNSHTQREAGPANDSHRRGSVASVLASSAVPRTNRSDNSENNSTGVMNNSHTRAPSVKHNDHLWSQQKIESRRAARPAADTSLDTSYYPPEGNQVLTVVPAPAVVKYNTRSPRNDEDDPLEMNTPIADRVRQRSVVAANRGPTAGSAAAAAAAAAATPPAAPAAAGSGGFYMVSTLEGTELLPSLPRLQGRKKRNSDEDDRTYRTIVRFIEYQPEEEREGLEEMLRNFSGREEELCTLLTETYGEDFEMLKSACHRGPSVPLIADRPKTSSVDVSPRSNGGHDHTSRVLLLGEATTTVKLGVSKQRERYEQQQQQQEGHYSSSSYQGKAEAEDSYAAEQQQSGVKAATASRAERRHDDDGDENYDASSQPYSTPRVEEGDYDEEPVYDEGDYTGEMLTPAVPYEQR